MTIRQVGNSKKWSAARQMSAGRCRTVLLAAAVMFSSISYGDSGEHLIKQAKIDTAKRFVDYYADELREHVRTNKPHLSSQEIDTLILESLQRRAECEVDAMVALEKEMPEIKESDRVILLSWLAGKQYAENIPVALSTDMHRLFKKKKEHCDEAHYNDIVF